MELKSVNEYPVADIDIEAVKKIIFELLGAVGEDPAREGLKNTPDRVARMYSELLSGYRDLPAKVVNGALFLASDESSYVNGTSFLVDGGLTAAYVTPE